MLVVLELPRRRTALDGDNGAAYRLGMPTISELCKQLDSIENPPTSWGSRAAKWGVLVAPGVVSAAALFAAGVAGHAPVAATVAMGTGVGGGMACAFWFGGVTSGLVDKWNSSARRRRATQAGDLLLEAVDGEDKETSMFAEKILDERRKDVVRQRDESNAIENGIGNAQENRGGYLSGYGLDLAEARVRDNLRKQGRLPHRKSYATIAAEMRDKLPTITKTVVQERQAKSESPAMPPNDPSRLVGRSSPATLPAISGIKHR